jgi:cytochrome c biogenesis protein CcmG, thiol:disulfide interchange protein DsbE
MTLFPEIRQELYETAARRVVGSARPGTRRQRGWLGAGVGATPLLVSILATAAVAFVAPTAPQHGKPRRAPASRADSRSALSQLHAQAGRLLPSSPGLDARVGALRGLPIVINAWAAWCAPCRENFARLESVSRRYDSRVAFLGADTNDTRDTAQSFLAKNVVSFPSYQTTAKQLGVFLPAGLKGLPTTIFLDPAGKVAYVHLGEYTSRAALERDIAAYARPQAR